MDVMRQQYRQLSDAEKQAMQEVKADAAALFDKLTGYGSSRELSVAKTKLEELVMWATKHITGAGINGGTVTTLDSGGGSNTNPPEPGQPPKKPK